MVVQARWRVAVGAVPVSHRPPVTRQAFTLAQEQQRELLGPAHPKIANTLNNLGVLLSKRERFREAEPLLRESLAMARKLHGDQHPTVATGMGQLGNTLARQGRHDEAEPLYVEALAIRRASLAPGHPHIAVSLNQLANLYREQHDFARAEPLYHEAIAASSESVGAEHHWTVAMTGNLGMMYLLAERPGDAEEALREVLRIHLKTLPEDHWRVADARSKVGAALVEQGMLDAAEPLLETGYTGLKQALGEEDPNTREARRRLARWREARDAGA